MTLAIYYPPYRMDEAALLRSQRLRMMELEMEIERLRVQCAALEKTVHDQASLLRKSVASQGRHQVQTRLGKAETLAFEMMQILDRASESGMTLVYETHFPFDGMIMSVLHFERKLQQTQPVLVRKESA